MKLVKIRHIASILLLFALLVGCEQSEQMRTRMQFVAECNRADTVFTERWMPTVDSLVNYFKRHGTDNERMMAYYLQGRVLHDMGEAPQALDAYQRATEQADTTREDCNLRTLTAIYGQMADLFDAQYLPDNEMKTLQMAERIAWKDKDTLSAIKAYELRIRPYFLKTETDSMLSIMQEARRQYLQFGHRKEAAQAIYPTISILLDRQQIQEAKRYLDLYEQESGNFDKNGELIFGGHYYYNKGRYLLAVGHADYACYYFGKALGRGQKEAGYRGLLSVYEKKNIPDSIAKYAKLFAAANDSNFLHVNQEKVHQITAMYDYSHHQRIAEEKTAEARRANRDKAIIIFVTLLLLTVAILIFIKLKNRAKREYARLVNDLEENQNMLADAIDKQRLLNYDYEKVMKEKELEQQELLQRIHASQNTISSVLDDKNRLQQELNELHAEQEFLIKQHEEDLLQKKQEIHGLEENLQQLESRLEQFSSVDKEAAFKKTAIFKHFNERRNEKYIHKPPTDKDWHQLTELFQTHFVRYYSFIAITHRLPINQFRYCVLLRLGFDGNDIGILMNKDKDQRYNLRKFIYEELFGKPVQVKLLEEKLKQHF